MGHLLFTLTLLCSQFSGQVNIGPDELSYPCLISVQYVIIYFQFGQRSNIT